VKLELDANGVPEIQDGKPVYVHDDGKEVAIDVPAMQLRIGQLNEEAKNHRLAAKAATDKLATFAGIEDPAAAGEAEKVKAEIKAAYETLKAAGARPQSGATHTGHSGWPPAMDGRSAATASRSTVVLRVVTAVAQMSHLWSIQSRPLPGTRSPLRPAHLNKGVALPRLAAAEEGLPCGIAVLPSVRPPARRPSVPLHLPAPQRLRLRVRQRRLAPELPRPATDRVPALARRRRRHLQPRGLVVEALALGRGPHDVPLRAVESGHELAPVGIPHGHLGRVVPAARDRVAQGRLLAVVAGAQGLIHRRQAGVAVEPASRRHHVGAPGTGRAPAGLQALDRVVGHRPGDDPLASPFEAIDGIAGGGHGVLDQFVGVFGAHGRDRPGHRGHQNRRDLPHEKQLRGGGHGVTSWRVGVGDDRQGAITLLHGRQRRGVGGRAGAAMGLGSREC
jgi:hypothetical protein